MKNIFIGALFLSLLVGCQNEVEKEIASYVTPISGFDEDSLEFIAEKLKDKDIVILGEVGHGEGVTTEAKAKLIKYLFEKKGFNTLAIEGEGFFDMELLNGREEADSLLVFENPEKWRPAFAYCTQAAVLHDYMKQNKDLKYIGIEGRSSYITHHVSSKAYLLSSLAKLGADETILQKTASVYEAIYGNGDEDTTIEQIDFLQEQLEKIRLSPLITKNDFMKQMLKNEYIELENRRYLEVIGGFDAENIYVNIRDKKMAENLIWHKERNPDAKIVVWIANFHGAKNIGKVRYKEEHPDTYKGFTLFNDYLVKEYGDRVYSMAFASSEGEGKDVFNSSELYRIEVPINSLEFELSKKNIDYGFIDFTAIRRDKPELVNKSFNSAMLGYDNKPGQWLQLFDGVFYIKKNEPLEKITSY